MNFQVVDSITDLKNNWSKLELPLFLRCDFLSGWGACNPSVKPLFFFNKSCRLYAQIFTLKLFKTLNYSYKFSIIAHVFRLFQLQVLYFGNCYMTNFPFFISKQKYDIKQITDDVNLDWSALIVPDFFINHLTHTKKYNFFKLEVEEDMVLDIRENWLDFNAYVDDLRSKYRKKINTILEKSKDMNIVELCENDINAYSSDLQNLFNHVISESKFSGPAFNIKTLAFFVKKKHVKVYGYFLKDHVVGFSSEFKNGNDLYAYYVGFEEDVNKNYAIYGRILTETIRNAINCKSQKIIFGRSASEFKSNFGAYPVKSHIFIWFKSNFLNYFFKFFLRQIHIAPWVQRRPFK